MEPQDLSNLGYQFCQDLQSEVQFCSATCMFTLLPKLINMEQEAKKLEIQQEYDQELYYETRYNRFRYSQPKSQQKRIHELTPPRATKDSAKVRK